MSEDFTDTSDLRLRQLLRASYPAPPLPPGFRESVWRRVELAETNRELTASWLEGVAAWILRPRLALASGIILLVLGASLGLKDGSALTHQSMQERYLTAVSPAAFYH